MISLNDVCFSYGSRKVLSHLSLTVPRGQLLGIIGPNGAGKSTVVRLLTGLLSPTSGSIQIGNREVSSYARREFARIVAVVPQEEALEFPFTVMETILMGRTAHLSPFGFERAADLAAAERALEETGTRDLRDRPLYTLSGGERKRVFLARALAQDPQILILDEPAASLDIHHQIAIFDLLRSRHDQGITVIVVVHDLNLAAAYCERLLLLTPDAPALDGTVEDILTYTRVKEVFGVDVYVGVNEITGARFLIPMSAKR